MSNEPARALATSARVLHAESFAPWCERARWALDHHRVAYVEVEQRPLLAEVSLRLALRRLRGRVTVPLLLHAGGALMESDAIARYAEEHGDGARLFAAPEVEGWMAASERLMLAGRALLLPRIAADPAALEEHLPGGVPRVLCSVLRPIAALGVRHLMRKYGVRATDASTHETTMRDELVRIRGALDGGRRHLVADGLSYADITIAAALQFVQPVAERFIRLAPATRAAWTHRALAREFADLIAWRDGLYAEHRRPGGR